MLMVEGEQDIEMSLEVPKTTRPFFFFFFFGLGGHLFEARMSLLEANRNLSKLSKKRGFLSSIQLG